MELVKRTKGVRKALLHRRSAIVLTAIFLALSVVGFGYAGSPASTQKPATPTSKMRNLRTFEELHTDKLMLTCKACHVSRKAPSYFRVEAGVLEFAPTNDRVTVNRQACFLCHAPSMPIYGDRALKAGELYRK